jgi:hypothetical protein
MDQNLDPRWMIEPPRGTEPGGIVDAWLRQELKHRYDEALHEPLPRGVVELLEPTGCCSRASCLIGRAGSGTLQAWTTRPEPS